MIIVLVKSSIGNLIHIAIRGNETTCKNLMPFPIYICIASKFYPQALIKCSSHHEHDTCIQVDRCKTFSFFSILERNKADLVVILKSMIGLYPYP